MLATTEQPSGGSGSGRPAWLGIELRHMIALAAVARESSFRGAADSLGYVPSAVSQQLARLERIVGARLIERRRGLSEVAPTEAGILLLRHFEEIMIRLDAAQADIEALDEGRTGTLAVGVYDSVTTQLMPPIIGELARRCPRVEVRMQSPRRPLDRARSVEAGELDVAFGDLPLPPGPFEHKELLEDPYVLLVPAGSPLSGADPAPLDAELADLPLIGRAEGSEADAVELRLRARGIEPRYVVRTDSDGGIQALVAAGIGAAITPGLNVDPLDPATTALPLEGLLEPRVVVVYWHRERRRIAARDLFVEVAATCARILRAPG